MPASRATASSLPVTSGSPPGLALVITSTRSCGASSHAVPAGRPAASWNSRYCSGVYGSITPSHARPGRDAGQRVVGAARLRSSTIGRSARLEQRRARPASTSAQRARRRDVGHHHRERLFLARLALRAAGRRLAALRASQARWKPPRPLIATISPRAQARHASRRRDRRRATRLPVARRASASRGPQAGHALGSAWKRRSRGERYSARHARALRERRHAGRSRGRTAARRVIV